MAELVIIGNGFDLAHGLKTSYQDFLRWLFKKADESPDEVESLFIFKRKLNIRVEQIDFNRERKTIQNFCDWKSDFLFKIFDNPIVENWSDLEFQYFKQLKETTNPKVLNEGFNLIKEFLVEYLKYEQKNFKPLPQYYKIFQNLDQQESKTLILNFNYTCTLDEYLKYSENIELVHLHGTVNSAHDEIIFGYSAKTNETRVLLDKNIPEYLDNIKRFQYNRNDIYSRVKTFLKSNRLNVNIIGHSCGVSDAEIMSEILDNQTTDYIKIFYHNDFKHYHSVQTAIARVSSLSGTFGKTLNYKDSTRMPQHDDEL